MNRGFLRPHSGNHHLPHREVLLKFFANQSDISEFHTLLASPIESRTHYGACDGPRVHLCIELSYGTR
ncbi:hypothetical protein ABH941_004716 [Streptacidiphilus sp. EB103A]